MKEYQPSPLFSALELLDIEFDQHISQIKLHLPNTISLSDAISDYKFSCQFLQSYRGSTETFKSYRREIERLLQWSWFNAGLSLKSIRRNDLEQFIEFCQNPPIHWIGIKNVARFKSKDGKLVPNPEWRPFLVTISKKAHREGQVPDNKSYMLSQSALNAIFATLSTFYNYLVQEEYISANPVTQMRQKSKFIRKYHGKKPIRRLSELQWSYILETAEMMAEEQPLLHERTLFIMNALFAMYLRISELASTNRWVPQMGHFYKDRDHNWWFKTVGKGNKERDVSVSNAMLESLKRYRLSLGLSALPSPQEKTPLISKIKSKGAITGTRHIRKIVQHCFDRAIDRLMKDGFIEDADTLISATVHWLRHTGISEDVKIRPREHVRDDAGHSSSAITDQYVDIELRERHATAKKKPIKLIE